MIQVGALLVGLWGGLLGQTKAGPYLGQPLPGREAVLFAPGILNSGLAVRDITLLPDGSEIYVGIFMPGFRKAVIVETHQEGSAWSTPEVAAFSRDPRWRCLEPCISPDGRRFFFVSDRPVDDKAGKAGPFGIWVMERQGRGWSEARRLPEAVNGKGNVFYPSITREGLLHFLQEEGQGGWLMRSAWKDGAWMAAEKLPPPFNANVRQANPPGGSRGPLHPHAQDGKAGFPGRGRLLRVFPPGGWHLDRARSSGACREQCGR
jgi:hypothetical protein